VYLDSLSLNQTMDLAFQNNPQYYESKISLDKSRTLYVQALCNYLPTLSVSGSYTDYETNGQGSHPYSGSVSISQPLLDIDIIGSIVNSRHQSKITQFQHESDIAMLMLDVKTSYYNLIYAYELVVSSEIAIKQAQESLDLIETKYNIGAASKLDKLQAEVYYLSAQQDRAKAHTVLINAQSKLKSLLASEHDVYPTDSLIAPAEFQFPSLDTLLIAMQRANYSIQIAEKSEMQARSHCMFSYLAFLPKISFFYGYSSSLESFTWDYGVWQDNAHYNYGVRVSLPIFELKSLIFDNITARQDIKMQEYATQNTILQQRQSLQATYAGLVEVHEQLHLAEKSLNAATEARKIAQAQYALGTISFIELLKAEQDAYGARVSHISALSDFYNKRSELSYLIGSITEEIQ
jgi:outer membrane protein TolC